MLRFKALFLLVTLSLATFTAFALPLDAKDFENDSVIQALTQEETILYNMINDIRVKNMLPTLPLSPDLCVVAHTHINDLITNRPQDYGCNLQSWSSAGNWVACCNTREKSDIQCMTLKPSEITGYQGNGYELIYWEEQRATPAEVAELWQQVDASANMILSRGKWKAYHWKALGIGMKDGYAVLWLGDKADKKPVSLQVNTSTLVNPKIQKGGTSVKIPVEKNKQENNAINSLSYDEQGSDESKASVKTGPGYYLIVASLTTPESAQSELKRIKSKGYPDAFILSSETLYRISIGKFDSEQKARARLNQLRTKFPGIWVFKQ